LYGVMDSIGSMTMPILSGLDGIVTVCSREQQ
jgi:hypothetical protein